MMDTHTHIHTTGINYVTAALRTDRQRSARLPLVLYIFFADEAPEPTPCERGAEDVRSRPVYSSEQQ